MYAALSASNKFHIRYTVKLCHKDCQQQVRSCKKTCIQHNGLVEERTVKGERLELPTLPTHIQIKLSTLEHSGGRTYKNEYYAFLWM